MNQNQKNNILYKKSENKSLEDLLKEGFVARSSASLNLLRQIKSIATSSASVLIIGESGTGKEMVAKLCHKMSQVSQGPFVPVNCAALPDSLFESELFGHCKGAFTGAVQHSEGLIRQADKGTLFLDEVGELSFPIQAKLLRVTQEKTVRQVGGAKEAPVDVRFICATNKNLLEACEQGLFRQDLYFRISVIPIFVPSLRQRMDDILPLAIHFMNRISSLQHRPPKDFTDSAKERLLNHSWPGNIRELNNVIERAFVYSSGNKINEGDILFDSQYSENFKNGPKKEPVPVVNLKSLEKIAITKALEDANGIKKVAAKKLGIDRKTLNRKEREYRICL